MAAMRLRGDAVCSLLYSHCMGEKSFGMITSYFTSYAHMTKTLYANVIGKYHQVQFRCLNLTVLNVFCHEIVYCICNLAETLCALVVRHGAGESGHYMLLLLLRYQHWLFFSLGPWTIKLCAFFQGLCIVTSLWKHAFVKFCSDTTLFFGQT